MQQNRRQCRAADDAEVGGHLQEAVGAGELVPRHQFGDHAVFGRGEQRAVAAEQKDDGIDDVVNVESNTGNARTAMPISTHLTATMIRRLASRSAREPARAEKSRKGRMNSPLPMAAMVPACSCPARLTR